MTTYLNPSADEVYDWLRAGLCVWCGTNCDYDNCKLRHCDSCTANWLGDTPVGLNDGRPVTEECPDCLADKILIDQIELEVRSDLYVAGHDEEGQPYTAESYKILATFKNGERLVFEKHYPGCEAERFEDEGFSGTYFKDVREQALAAAERQMTQFEKDGAIYRSMWSEHEPMYGTPAYEMRVAEMTPEERAQ